MPTAKIFGIPAWLVFGVLFLVLVFPSGVFIAKSFDTLDEILLSISTQPASETDRLLQMAPSDDGTFEKRAVVALERDVIVGHMARCAQHQYMVIAQRAAQRPAQRFRTGTTKSAVGAS